MMHSMRKKYYENNMSSILPLAASRSCQYQQEQTPNSKNTNKIWQHPTNHDNVYFARGNGVHSSSATFNIRKMKQAHQDAPSNKRTHDIAYRLVQTIKNRGGSFYHKQVWKVTIELFCQMACYWLNLNKH